MIMRILFLLLLSISSFGQLVNNNIMLGATEEPPAIVIYAFGQSNMAGYNNSTSNVPSGYTGEMNRVFVWNGTSCEKMNATGTNNNQFPNITGGRNGSFACEVTLCKDLADLTGAKVYLCKYAVGSTGLVTDGGNGTWSPYDTELYDDSRDEIAAFNTWMDSNVPDHIKSTVIWIQGEQDAEGAIYDDYLIYEDDFIRGMRTAIDPAQFVNWITVGIQSTSGTNAGNVNKVKHALSDITQSVYWFPSDGYGVQGDNTHFTTAAHIAIGEDLAIQISGQIEGSATDTFLGAVWNANLWTANDGFTISSNTLTGNGTQNNGRAYSKRVIKNGADGYVEYTVPSGFNSYQLHAFGLDGVGAIDNGNWVNTLVGFVIDNPDGQIRAAVAGVLEGTAFTVTAGDVIRIEIVSGAITLKQNGTTKHTYSVSQSADYAAKCSTHTNFANNPTFNNVKMQSSQILDISSMATVDLSNY